MFLGSPPVPDKMQRLLDEVSRQSEERATEVFDLVQQDESMPTGLSCTWWDGCYYCRDEEGKWHSVRCVT